VRHEDIPEINNPKIRFPVLEGDKLMKEKNSKRQDPEDEYKTKMYQSCEIHIFTTHVPAIRILWLLY